MNTEETLKLGRDIDAISNEADNLSRLLARLASRCGVKPTPEPSKNTEPTDEQIASACLSFRHDYGLLTEVEQACLECSAVEWLRAWRKEGLI